MNERMNECIYLFIYAGGHAFVLSSMRCHTSKNPVDGSKVQQGQTLASGRNMTS